jgi:hypothetical protein
VLHSVQIKANLLKDSDAKSWIYSCETCSHDRQTAEENDVFILLSRSGLIQTFFIGNLNLHRSDKRKPVERQRRKVMDLKL